MLTLLTEARFWSMREDIFIKDTDFGAFRYQDKKETSTSDIFAEGKRDYAEKRDSKCILPNKRPGKLRDSLKRLDEHLKQHTIVYCRWKDSTTIQIILSNGLMITISIDCFTGDITRLIFDKYFIGKLTGETITDALITRLHILLAYNQNQLTLVYLQKPEPAKHDLSGKLTDFDPKIYNVIINGPENRPIPRQISCNCKSDLIVVWTKSSQNEVYPWRPTIRDQDRANVHIYKLSRIKLEALCYYWTENDPISIEFSNIHHNQLHSVEQKISRKGEVTVEVCMFEIKKSRLHRMATTAIPLQTQVCCHSFSPDNEKVMLGCIDGSLVIFDESRGITHLVKAAFIPTLVSWHCDSALLTIANDRCQFQCFDISLACIKTQPISEDIPAANVLDLSGYFVTQPTLLNLWWNYRPHLSVDGYAQNDSFILLNIEDGPLVCLRFVCGGNFKADVLIDHYINLNSIEKAINLLLCLNWDTYGSMCLGALNRIANYILTRELTTERELQLQKALGSFHVPVKPLCPETEDEFGEPVRHITRRFFFYMLRYGSYEKAFSLAIDINDEDLFFDLHDWAEMDGEIDLAKDAYAKAEEIIGKRDEEHDSESICSNSSCSECASTSTDESDGESEEETISKKSSEIDETRNIYQTASPSSSRSSIQFAPQPSTSRPPPSTIIMNRHPPLPNFPPKSEKYRKKSYIPPLPQFSAAASNVRINIPKPELKVSAFSKNQHRNLKPRSTNSHHPSANFTPDNILLVDPPLPTLPRSNSHSNIAHGYPDFIPDITRTQLYHNSFSTESLNRLKLDDETKSAENGGTKTRKAPKALPRTGLMTPQPQQHTVIDVVPKPISTPATTDWQVPDQTLGIPLTYTHTIQPRITKASSSSYIYAGYHSQQQHPITLSTENLYSSAAHPIIHQYPVATGKIPPVANALFDFPTKKPPTLSILTTKDGPNAPGSILTNQQTTSMASATSKKEPGEKNKVKFSDTVTVAVVPEIPRKDKSLIDRMKRPNGFSALHTDPRKELADSLPLCSPNDEYLKDFTPMSSVAESKKKDDDKATDRPKPSTIKVVHFGVV